MEYNNYNIVEFCENLQLQRQCNYIVLIATFSYFLRADFITAMPI